MLNKFLSLLIFLVFGSCAFASADSPSDIEKNAMNYDWQTCMNDKMSNCASSCDRSEDPDCDDDCSKIAADKCEANGLSAPTNNEY